MARAGGRLARASQVAALQDLVCGARIAPRDEACDVKLGGATIDQLGAVGRRHDTTRRGQDSVPGSAHLGERRGAFARGGGLDKRFN